MSHLNAGGCQVLPERLDGLRPVVLNELWQRVMAGSVATDQKLSWFTLIDDEMSTAIPAPAARTNS